MPHVSVFDPLQKKITVGANIKSESLIFVVNSLTVVHFAQLLIQSHLLGFYLPEHGLLYTLLK